MGHFNEYLAPTAGFHRCEYEPLCTAISIQDLRLYLWGGKWRNLAPFDNSVFY